MMTMMDIWKMINATVVTVHGKDDNNGCHKSFYDAGYIILAITMNDYSSVHYVGETLIVLAVNTNAELVI